jgi:hypothetical protein
MENDSKIAGKIKSQITHFGHKISCGYKKPARKFIVQMLYGIQASKDVKLSNISRSLNEEIPLIKTEGRLSRNIGKEDLTAMMNRRVIADGAGKIQRDTVIAIDISDIDKPYAQKMENLTLVRDGSSGERKSSGYWLLSILGADVEGEDLIPLYGELYSQEAGSFKSENRQILDAMDTVRDKTGTKGIWAIDRGGDRAVLLKGFLTRGVRFVVRMVGNRMVIHDGGKERMAKVVRECSCPDQREVIIEKNGETKKKVIWIGHVEVGVPFHKEPLFLVVVRGYSEKPLMLLTNVDVEAVGTVRILEIYLTRWKCEESYRFIKQAYHLEDVRVLSYTALRNMVVLVQAVFYFVSVELGKKVKLNILLKKIYEKAKRFFAIPDFRQYAIADGIYNLLCASRTGIIPSLAKREDKRQLLLPFAVQLF